MLSRHLLVSHGGKDVIFCGNSSAPCRSVRFAVNISSSGDVILIEHAQGKPYQECENIQTSNYPILLSKSLSFVGRNGTAVIQCRRSTNLFRIQGYASNRAKIVLVNIVILRSFIALHFLKTNFELVLERCVLKDHDTAVHTKGSAYCSVRTFNSTFTLSRSLGIWASCTNLKVNFTSTLFHASPVVLKTIYGKPNRTQVTEVFVSNSEFDSRRRNQHNCQLLYIQTFGVIVNISIHATRFSNHFGNCQGRKTHALSISDNSYRKRRVTHISLDKLLVENFNSSSPAINLSPHYRITTYFKAELLNSIFRNNAGSLFVGIKSLSSYVSLKSPSVLLWNNTFLKNHHLNDAFHRVASAVYFYSGRGRVVFCRFLDNISGNVPESAVVTISEKAIVMFKDCYFENTQLHGKSVQIYSMRQSTIELQGNNTFNIIALKSDQPIFIHLPLAVYRDGVSNVLLKGSLTILCPHGYRLSSDNVWRVIHNKIVFTYVYCQCLQCPQKTYSLSRGELYNNITHDIQCHDCPRGGNCVGGQVTAKPNFWGYRMKNKVTFLACPLEYCCDNENCSSYDGCYGNRSGTLCGQCTEGMSESLLNARCKLNEECQSLIFSTGISCLVTLYLIFFLYHEEITSFVRKSLFLKLHLILRIRENDVQGRESKASGLLKIIFYYYQIVHLFRNCAVANRSQRIPVKLEKLFSRTLNLIVADFLTFDCPFQNLRPVVKAVILHSVGYCLLVLVGLIYAFTKLFRIIKKLRRVNDHDQQRILESFETIDQTGTSSTPFSTRIVSAFTYISLLMYSSSAQLCLSLLHCVPVGRGHVLFIDGTIQCYQTFQYLVFAYVIFSILPFFLVPVLGSYLLKVDRISVSQFCLACVFPLPFCCFWLYLLLSSRIRCRGDHSYESLNHDTKATTQVEDDDSQMTPKKAILCILLGPFRSQKPVLCFPSSFLPWEGFLIFRRLVLIIALTFIYDHCLRMIVALIICVAILISHMYVNPFISSRDNLIETMSLGTLIVFCGLTLVQALYQGEDFSSSSNSLSLLMVFDGVENVLIVTPLAILFFVVALSLLIKLMSGFRSWIKACHCRLGRHCGRK